jgi:hypothetical protein
MPNRALCTRITTSEQQAMPKPPPTAGPSTIAITGIVSALSAISTSPKTRYGATRGSGSPTGGGGGMSVMAPMSPPAQNAPPLPRSTSTRMEASAPTRATASPISCIMACVSALRRCGRLKVSRATSAVRARRMVS